ncbi:MAG: NAD-dependent epimerase/dehydratase family protein [Chitinophagaceae bacterium]|nr:NAD-dependent epimerase/dehydratase family protein [Chitinophagaceae bacterium]
MTGNKNKILITGASGNLGSWMMEHFASSFEVVGLARQEGAASPNGEHRMVYADITNEDRLKQILGEEKPAIVIHLASVNESFLPGYADLALAVNAGGTSKLLRACAEIPLERFVYFSTFHVYGKNNGLINEDTPTAPANDYAMTHLFAEQYVQMLAAGKISIYDLPPFKQLWLSAG